MPIVFVHGVATRDDDADLAKALKPFGDVPWETVEGFLREHIAPVISRDPEGVPILRAYWGDLGAHFAFNGRSLVSRPGDPASTASDAPDAAESPSESKSSSRAGVGKTLKGAGIRGVKSTVTALRKPLEGFIPTFLGDVLTYLVNRGTAASPGPIPERVLATLETAQFAKDSRDGEPLIVLTHSMGGQIVYDLITYFIPQLEPARPELEHLRIDYWCAAASQIGLFEELKLFLASEPDTGAGASDGGADRLVPHPDRSHLGGWWNVWDHADLVSFRAGGIFEDVDDSAFFAAGSLATDHNRYLDNPAFYAAFAEKVRVGLTAEQGTTGG